MSAHHVTQVRDGWVAYAGARLTIIVATCQCIAVYLPTVLILLVFQTRRRCTSSCFSSVTARYGHESAEWSRKVLVKCIRCGVLAAIGESPATGNEADETAIAVIEYHNNGQRRNEVTLLRWTQYSDWQWRYGSSVLALVCFPGIDFTWTSFEAV